jgi:sugar lactone lactonase YvrE
MRPLRWPLILSFFATCFGLVSLPCFAATTTTWEMNGYQDFLRGRLSGLSLTRDGRLIPGPKIDTIFSSDQPEIWSIAQGPDGSLYLGTGHRGRVYKIDATGNSSLLWTADQPEIFAVAVDPNGVVYAATSPDGKVYRIANGKAEEYFAPAARYIWALQFLPDGTLFVATGDQGRIFRVTSAGHGDVYYETGQSHVTSLAVDRERRLLAGSEPNGILYRITAANQAFVLYDANLPEIRAIVPGPDGVIYAAALGGSVARRIGTTPNPNSTSTPTVVGPATSITVTDTQGGLNPAPEAPKPVSTPPAAASVTTATTLNGAEYTGVERSALYKINPDNTVETLWSSKEENAYDLALSGGELMFVTDSEGRIYRLDRDRKAILVAQANEGEATRLLASANGLIAATGGLGKVLRLGNSPGPGGWFESPVHDSGTIVRWGRLTWLGDAKGVAFKTRTGNSLRPDATWSEWSAPITDPDRSAITSPNARYIQWRAEFTPSPVNPGAAPQGPAGGLDDVTIAYLPQNTPPNIRSISVTTQAQSTVKTATAGSSSTNTAFTVNVTDTGEAPPAAGTSAQTLSRIAGQQIQVSWQADDPENDRLTFSLYFRGQDERDWKLIRANMTENTFLLDPDMFADGRYLFKVTASDRLSNAANQARESDLVSAPVLIDNTPPVVTAGAPRRNGAAIDIDIDAEDRGSTLRRCEYSVDAGPWLPVEASDGVTDSPRERFPVRIESLSPGEHLIAVRVYDAAGNAGLTKIVVR